ncbi:MAG: tRNA lysidine(34) synthetase TilS [Blastocatellia bacterium]
MKLRVMVAVSGGADSTALLDALVRLCESDELAVTVLAAHLNHQLRGEESDEDEQFVRDAAARLGAPIFIERIDVGERARAETQNWEATARRVRYDFLRRVAEQNRVYFVLTAHTQDDQAETILMRLLRGAGAEGLRGIHEIMPLGEHTKLIRPMLTVTRAEVIAHCEHYGLAFRADSSNLDSHFTRNHIRHELLPLLRDFNPRVEEALSRAAELLTKDDAYLRGLAAECFAATGKGSSLDIVPLLDVVPAIRRRVLRLWLKTQCGGLRRIELAHIEAIDYLIARGQSGRRVELPGDLIVAREFNHLKLIHAAGQSPESLEPVELKEDEPQDFGDFRFTLKRGIARRGLELNNGEKRELFAAPLRECEELGELRLRTRFPGDAYIPVNARRAVKLKTLMIRRKIPLSKRDKYPILVTADDCIVWAPGLPVAREFAPNGGDEGCALIAAEKLR